MEKLIASLAVLVSLTGGVVATVVETAAPATGAVVCAQPIDPTVRYIVNTVCSKFGP
ncbi:MAG: hypothetical protein QOG34_2167 [Frankiaceae bacterium]|jgi:hypothetical protein|nr:hypothetical protein [Frankiaceae bacterium]